MKTIAQLTAGSILLIGILASCGNPLDGGMWTKQHTPDDEAGYWINFYAEEETEELRFDFIGLSSAYEIDFFYNGTYAVDTKEKTVTLSAERETDGSPDEESSDTYAWEDSTWENTLTYATEGDSLILEGTIREEKVQITLAPPEQPVDIQRALRAAE